MTPDVVVMGGTFDPVHWGHLRVLQQVLDRTRATSGLLVPAAVPSLRTPALAPAADRLAMLRAAVAVDPRLQVDDLELRRCGVSYTVDTMRELRARDPGRSHALLLGADAARRIGAWHRAAELLATDDFVLVNRTGEAPLRQREARELGFAPSRTLLLSVDSPPLSASLVRARIAAGESLDGLVPPEVAEIIQREHLYLHAAGRA